MRALIQRVSKAGVSVEQGIPSEIGMGLLVLLVIESKDTQEYLKWLVSKITQMRIFADADGKMNASLLDIKGELLVISQFTLHASTRKGNRPSFLNAARPEIAMPLYDAFLAESAQIVPVKSGVFGTNMQVSLLNDGPVTIWLDSKNRE